MNFKGLFMSFASIILGALLFFFSILCFQAGGGALIALGVVSLLVGLLYIGASLLKMFGKSEQVSSFGGISSLCMVTGYLVYVITYDIVMIVARGGRNIGFLSWVINIGAMASALAVIVFAILVVALKKDNLSGFKGIFLALFFAFVLVSFVFLDGGGLATIADISLYSVINLFCYGSIVFNDIKLPGKDEEEDNVSDEPEAEDNVKSNGSEKNGSSEPISE